MESRNPDLDFIYRRNIFSLKPGTQIPGYTGHRPGVRFGFGNTYGDLTHQLNPINIQDNIQSFDYNKDGEDISGSVSRSQSLTGRKVVNQNPKNNSSAMSKLLKGLDLDEDDLDDAHQHNFSTKMFSRAPPTGLKSGYTGYVPRLRYHFGSSYNPSSNEAKKEFSHLQQIDRSNKMDLNGSLESILYSKYSQELKKPLIPINDDDRVLEELLKFEEQRRSRDTLMRPNLEL